MNSHTKRYFIAVMIAFTMPLYAQYYGEQVLEKSFEVTDFFFRPFNLNPYGLGAFKTSAPGLIDDPLLNLTLNPAALSSDAIQDYYLYIDFRSAKEVQSGASSRYYPLEGSTKMVSDAMYFPRYYYNVRKEIEPVFSGAFLSRPFPSAMPRLTLGLAYQAMMQDERYYAIPQDVYRSSEGKDYLGRATSNETVPIIDRYSGTDKMNQRGHLFALYAAYQWSNNLHLGVKLGRGLFDRDGSVGSSNLWGYGQAQNYNSLWSNSEHREQNYRHWETAAGATYQINDLSSLGASLGTIWGDAVQELQRSDTSFYGSGTIGVGTNWSYNTHSGRTLQSWNHDNSSLYGSLYYNRRFSEKLVMSIQYQFLSQDDDLSLFSSLRDSSYSNYYYTSTNYESKSKSDYTVLDRRTGSGTKTLREHNLLLASRWKIGEETTVDVGLGISFHNTTTTTSEPVFADRHSRYESYYKSGNISGEGKYYDAATEEKSLLWEFSSNITTYHIPVMVKHRVSESITIFFGVDRKLSSWEINDMTLAVFAYRYLNSNGTENRTTNFGERYTQPKEVVTDVRTTVLGGVEVSLASMLNLRLLAVPNFTDSYEGSKFSQLQWWISVTLHP
ncbi:MAG: hypothetical protein V1799_18380 [bacterium]